MIEINLVPDVKQELLRAKRARSLVITGAIVTSIIAVAVVVLLLIYIYGFQSIRHVTLDNDIKKQNEQFSKVEDVSKILTIQNQLAKISELNSQKKIDSRIFDVLSAVVPPEPNSVQLSRINIDNEANSITIEGQTATFDSMEVFQKTLNSALITYMLNEKPEEVQLVKSLQMGDVSYGSNAEGKKVIIFTLMFEYAEELFSPDIAAIGFKLSLNGNVTDSYLGIPRSIFTSPATKEGGQ